MKDPVGGKTPHVQDLLNAHEPLIGGLLPRMLRWCTQCALACTVSYDRANNIIVKQN